MERGEVYHDLMVLSSRVDEQRSLLAVRLVGFVRACGRPRENRKEMEIEIDSIEIHFRHENATCEQLPPNKDDYLVLTAITSLSDSPQGIYFREEEKSIPILSPSILPRDLDFESTKPTNLFSPLHQEIQQAVSSFPLLLN